MRIYTVSIKNTDDGSIGFGIKIDGKQADCGDLSQEDSLAIRGIIEAVNMKIYHEAFIAEHGKCPTCNVKSVFGDELQKM